MIKYRVMFQNTGEEMWYRGTGMEFGECSLNFSLFKELTTIPYSAITGISVERKMLQRYIVITCGSEKYRICPSKSDNKHLLSELKRKIPAA